MIYCIVSRHQCMQVKSWLTYLYQAWSDFFPVRIAVEGAKVLAVGTSPLNGRHLRRCSHGPRYPQGFRNWDSAGHPERLPVPGKAKDPFQGNGSREYTRAGHGPGAACEGGTGAHRSE